MRVKAFLSAGNERRDVSLGGRARNDRVWARLNTDNATQSDCSLFVSARVSQDRSYFNVELPEQGDENCEVVISDSRIIGRTLAELGVKLASTTDLKSAKKLLLELEQERKFPKVWLPGDVSLVRALAAVKILEGQ